MNDKLTKLHKQVGRIRQYVIENGIASGTACDLIIHELNSVIKSEQYTPVREFPPTPNEDK